MIAPGLGYGAVQSGVLSVSAGLVLLGVWLFAGVILRAARDASRLTPEEVREQVRSWADEEGLTFEESERVLTVGLPGDRRLELSFHKRSLSLVWDRVYPPLYFSDDPFDTEHYRVLLQTPHESRRFWVKAREKWDDTPPEIWFPEGNPDLLASVLDDTLKRPANRWLYRPFTYDAVDVRHMKVLLHATTRVSRTWHRLEGLQASERFVHALSTMPEKTRLALFDEWKHVDISNRERCFAAWAGQGSGPSRVRALDGAPHSRQRSLLQRILSEEAGDPLVLCDALAFGAIVEPEVTARWLTKRLRSPSSTVPLAPRGRRLAVRVVAEEFGRALMKLNPDPERAAAATSWLLFSELDVEGRALRWLAEAGKATSPAALRDLESLRKFALKGGLRTALNDAIDAVRPRAAAQLAAHAGGLAVTDTSTSGGLSVEE